MVSLEDLLVEELVGRHAEELVLFKTPVDAIQAYSVWIGAPSAPECPSIPNALLVGRILPTRDALVTPSLLELLHQVILREGIDFAIQLYQFLSIQCLGLALVWHKPTPSRTAVRAW